MEGRMLQLMIMFALQIDKNHKITRGDLRTKIFHHNNVNFCTTFFSFSSINKTESIAMLPPFGPIEGHKWFFQISS
jgi:hypothetical protein